MPKNRPDHVTAANEDVGTAKAVLDRMPMPDFNGWTVDEIIDWRVGVDEMIDVLRERLRDSKRSLDSRIMLDAATQALRQAGVEFTADSNGNVTLSPPSAIIGLAPGTPGEASNEGESR